MRKWISFLLAAMLLLSAGSLSLFAEEQISEEPVVREPGFCGESIGWNYADGILTLEGSGRTDDFYAGQPWQQYIGEIRELKLIGSISYLGAYAFPDYDALKIVNLGDHLEEIGQGAFSGCDGLTAVELPAAFRVFGEDSFSHCKNLTEFYFLGGMPKFKLNCLWDTYAKLLYPAASPWPLTHIQQLEEAFQGRIEFLSSDGTDPYVPEESTEPAATEAETTVPPTTEETTVPTTEAAETATEPETEVPQTSAETEMTEETVPATTEEYVVLPEPEQEKPGAEEENSHNLLLAGLIALMVLSGGGALLLLGNISRNKRKEFDGNFSEILQEDERKTQRKKPTVAQKKAGKKTGKQGGKYRK